MIKAGPSTGECSSAVRGPISTRLRRAGGLTFTTAAGTALTLVQSWQVYWSSCGHSAVAPLKLGSCMRMRGPAQALPSAGGSTMLHTGASRPCELGFHGCSQLRRSSLYSVNLWPALLLSSASAHGCAVSASRSNPI